MIMIIFIVIIFIVIINILKVDDVMKRSAQSSESFIELEHERERDHEEESGMNNVYHRY